MNNSLSYLIATANGLYKQAAAYTQGELEAIESLLSSLDKTDPETAAVLRAQLHENSSVPQASKPVTATNAIPTNPEGNKISPADYNPSIKNVNTPSDAGVTTIAKKASTYNTMNNSLSYLINVANGMYKKANWQDINIDAASLGDLGAGIDDGNSFTMPGGLGADPFAGADLSEPTTLMNPDGTASGAVRPGAAATSNLWRNTNVGDFGMPNTANMFNAAATRAPFVMPNSGMDKWRQKGQPSTAGQPAAQPASGPTAMSPRATHPFAGGWNAWKPNTIDRLGGMASRIGNRIKDNATGDPFKDEYDTSSLTGRSAQQSMPGDISAAAPDTIDTSSAVNARNQGDVENQIMSSLNSLGAPNAQAGIDAAEQRAQNPNAAGLQDAATGTVDSTINKAMGWTMPRGASGRTGAGPSALPASDTPMMSQQQIRDNTMTMGTNVMGGAPIQAPSVTGPISFDNSKLDTNLSPSTQPANPTEPVNPALSINQTHALNIGGAPQQKPMTLDHNGPSGVAGNISFDNSKLDTNLSPSTQTPNAAGLQAATAQQGSNSGAAKPEAGPITTANNLMSSAIQKVAPRGVSGNYAAGPAAQPAAQPAASQPAPAAAPVAAPTQPAAPQYDASKITRDQMRQYAKYTGANDMNSDMDKWKTWQAMQGNRNASNADYYAARRNGFK